MKESCMSRSYCRSPSRIRYIVHLLGFCESGRRTCTYQYRLRWLLSSIYQCDKLCSQLLGFASGKPSSVRAKTFVCLSDVFASLLLETTLDLSRVDTAVKNLFTVAFEPHLAALAAEVKELDPIDEALRVERRVFDLFIRLLQLSAHYPAFAPFVGLIRMLVE